MSSIHLDLLDKKRRVVFDSLKIFKEEAALAGGTALFLQIKHRHSFDFDVFLQRKLIRKDLLKLKQTFELKRIDVNIANQLTITIKQGVNVTLLNYPYKPFFKKVRTISLSLYSVKDIALDKAFALGRRATWRDYVDLFFILKGEYMDIFELIRLAPKKFGVEFNPKLFLEQLVYFADVQPTKISFIKEKYSVKEIQAFLREKAKEFKNKKIRGS